jgi:hypothetical protein
LVVAVVDVGGCGMTEGFCGGDATALTVSGDLGLTIIDSLLLNGGDFEVNTNMLLPMT